MNTLKRNLCSAFIAVSVIGCSDKEPVSTSSNSVASIEDASSTNSSGGTGSGAAIDNPFTSSGGVVTGTGSTAAGESSSPDRTEEFTSTNLPVVETRSIPTLEEALQRHRTVQLRSAIYLQFGFEGLETLLLPDSSNFDAIPQDAANSITIAKVKLGGLLFHDTAFARNGRSFESKTWSCAACHNAAAGFKPGIPQGIAEGGMGFGIAGAHRILAPGFDGNAEKDARNLPDIQPVAAPAILNVAYQDVLLWNGELGNKAAGSANSGLPASILTPVDSPNLRQLSGLETQAIAGIDVHRLKVDTDTPLQTNETYKALYAATFGNDATSGDVIGNAGKAIAAYERTILANKSPFQLWLRGDLTAMSDRAYRGASLFFGKAGCSGCHQGPALSSRIDAQEEEMFIAIGFRDFDLTDPRIHGSVSERASKGRGGFTKNSAQDFQFKIPQLYNLADSTVFGHGSSFSSIMEVLEYKNRAIPQRVVALDNLDHRFTPLGLSKLELQELEEFLTTGLYDPDLKRYQPLLLPSNECLIVDPLQIDSQGLCPESNK